ncbi:putative reverse transcriptase zinc-binding domain-containing protein [Helianthus annuus]|nr:putative reverse transcriptase zinc-binding domain-containing protein [Helianthus annuus]
MHWVAWDRVASPVDCGGLGIRSLDSINISLLLKWAWRFKSERGNLWVKVISAIHQDRRRLDFLPVKSSLGGVWGKIAKLALTPILAGGSSMDLMRGRVGNGSDMMFWLDPWLCNVPLKDCYPNLFRLENDKECVVRSRIVRPISNPVAKWDWKHPPDSSVELAEWMDLNSKLRDVVLNERVDMWEWMGDDNGEFSVGSIKRIMDKSRDFSSRYVWEWSSWVPLKCILFAWRAEMERLPTKVELRKRNIHIEDDLCPMCGAGLESASHLLTACIFASKVWSMVTRWCKVPELVAFSVRDILEFHNFCGLKGRMLAAFKGILVVTCWQLWKARNDLIFSNITRKEGEIVSSIKSIGFLWFKNRSKYKDVTWDDWCKFV